jgi:signal transduction histidine kinase
LINLFQLSIFTALLVSVILGILVFATNPRRTPNQIFLILTGALVVWLTCMALGSLADTVPGVVFWIRQASATGSLMPAMLSLLRLAIGRPRARWTHILSEGRLWLAAHVPIVALCQTRVFLESAILPARGSVVPQPVYGPGFLVFAAYLLVAAGIVVYHFIRDIQRLRGIQRTELQFILLGCTVALLAAIAFLIVPVVTGFNETTLFLPLSDVLRVTIVGYAIATRHILDVPYVLRRITAYALLAACLAGLYTVAWGAGRVVVQHFLPDAQFLPQLLATLAVAFFVAPAYGTTERFAARLFLDYHTLDTGRVVEKAGSVLTSIATLDELLAQFAAQLARLAGTDRILVLLGRNQHYVQQYPGPGHMPGLEFGRDHPIPMLLRQNHEPLVHELIPRARRTALLADAEQRMGDLQIAIAVGIYSQTELAGILLMGPRLSGRIFGAAESRALQILCNHFAVALANAKLYTQVQDTMIYNNILLDNLVSGVVAANTRGLVTVFNREAQRVTGLRADAVLNAPTDRLPAPLAAAMDQTFRTGVGLHDVDGEVRRDGEAAVSIRMSSALFGGHAGATLGALLVFHDLTEIRRLEEQVRRTDRLASVGTLAAGMAHEIKNPLVTVRTFAQLLPRRYEDSEFREQFSEVLDHEVQRIDALVNQLLRFSRPPKPALRPTHLHHVVDSTLRLMEHQFDQKGIVIQRDYRAARDMIQADAAMLEQALVNIALNAMEAMPGGGTVTVTTETVDSTRGAEPSPSDASIRLSIRDTGRGIPPENLPRVFDPFFTTKESGSGLGLSVAHGIVVEHGGSVDVESPPEGGAVFRLEFGLIPEEPAA